MDSETENLHLLLYVSTASEELSEDEVERLLSKARSKNERLGVTGLLLFYGEHIVQVLEGPEVSVRRLFATIREDRRHDKVASMVDEPIERRFFPDWSMAYRRSSNSAAVENVALQRLLESEERGTIDLVKKLFEIFGIHFGSDKKTQP